jgi:N-hydroxyarylamine O-acetyltransferase
MAAFDLASYMNRVGFERAARPDLDTLYALHQAHVRAIPFENLDVQLGRSIKLDAASLQLKMIQRRRGGYCFEHNGLFALALGAVGFTVETCEARVRQGAPGMTRARTHMVLRVPCAGRRWLVDVGFGGDGLVEPADLAGVETTQLGVVYRVVPEGSRQVLQRRVVAGWEDLYVVMPDPVQPIDFEVGNWYTSTHPASAFVLNLTAQRLIGGERHVLRNLVHSISVGADTTSREIPRGALIALLRDTFDLRLPDASRFRALDSPWQPAADPPED